MQGRSLCRQQKTAGLIGIKSWLSHGQCHDHRGGVGDGRACQKTDARFDMRDHRSGMARINGFHPDAITDVYSLTAMTQTRAPRAKQS